MTHKIIINLSVCDSVLRVIMFVKMPLQNIFLSNSGNDLFAFKTQRIHRKLRQMSNSSRKYFVMETINLVTSLHTLNLIFLVV